MGWNPALTATPTTVAFDGNYVYATLYDFNISTTIARFGADCTGAADADWNPVMNDSVYAMANRADGSMLVGGRFTAADGSARGGLAAFDAAVTTGCPKAIWWYPWVCGTYVYPGDKPKQFSYMLQDRRIGLEGAGDVSYECRKLLRDRQD